MNTYLFTTRTHMKDHNCSKWWIDTDIIRPMYIHADNIDQALTEYATRTDKDYGIRISKNALRTKEPMFIDRIDGTAEQVGYVITAKTIFDKGDYSGWSEQYIDLWTDIDIVENAFNVA